MADGDSFEFVLVLVWPVCAALAGVVVVVEVTVVVAILVSQSGLVVKLDIIICDVTRRRDSAKAW